MDKMKLLIQLIVVVLLIHNSVSLMCYQCSDSSEEDGLNDCQAWRRTLRARQAKFVEDGKLRTYVKNCTDFKTNPDDDVYCAIIEVELGGGVRSYIRDCSDGKNFFGGTDVNDKFSNMKPDNKTKCIYSGQGYLYCVTLCGQGCYESNSSYDFCNGPTYSGVDTVSGSLTMFVLTFVISSLYFYLNFIESGYMTDRGTIEL